MRDERLYKAKLKAVFEAASAEELANIELERALRDAIDYGVTFTDLGRTLGTTEAGIRQKANRRGWHEAGTRRSR
jgi:hypothetical protein